jgi:hypothetical protein
MAQKRFHLVVLPAPTVIVLRSASALGTPRPSRGGTSFIVMAAAVIQRIAQSFERRRSTAARCNDDPAEIASPANIG